MSKNLKKVKPKLEKPIGRVMKPKTPNEKVFNIYRDDETDEFKPYSSDAVDFMATAPLKTTLKKDEKLLFNSVAADLERSMSLENIVDEPQLPDLPEEVLIEIDKMPTWLGAMVTHRYDAIKRHFKDDTLKFLRNVNVKIDREYRPEFAYFEETLATETHLLTYEDEKDNVAMEKLAELESLDEDEKKVEKIFKTDANVVFFVTEAIGKWKRNEANARVWNPKFVHRVAKKFRQDLTLKPSDADLALTKENVVEHHHTDSEDSDFDETGKPKWEVIKRREHAQRQAEIDIEINLSRAPRKSQVRGYVDKAGIAKSRKDARMKTKLLRKRRHEKALGRSAMRRQLFTRGHFRRYSKLFSKGCGETSGRPKRLEYHYRGDDSFHHYVVTLVGTVAFKSLIMIIILLNAMVLTIEPLEEFQKYPLAWEVIDELFLSAYLVEAMLKIYAHPLGYWRSGFNVFDFCILVVSMIKRLNDWLDVADISVLRVLLIVRALRILRGISLSIQLQVLVAALAQTVKTHVLSVVILLVLLLYIAAIVAYYLFSDKSDTLGDSWGFVPIGMLRMMIFVTLDGWTDILEEFNEAGLETLGRVFNLMCIVLGNFMFSNIFIAIIILNISEATDLYRERMRMEKQEVVRRKKDNVFRRQKLDMRQLLAKQKKSPTADFYHLAEQFQKLLRHDDFVKMSDTCTSPLWLDALYKTSLRTYHTGTLLANLHRLMADNLVELKRFYNRGKNEVKSIRRGRYNRYMKIKAKLTLLKKEILNLRKDPPKSRLKIKLPTDDATKKAQIVPQNQSEAPTTSKSHHKKHREKQ